MTETVTETETETEIETGAVRQAGQCRARGPGAGALLGGGGKESGERGWRERGRERER